MYHVILPLDKNFALIVRVRVRVSCIFVFDKSWNEVHGLGIVKNKGEFKFYNFSYVLNSDSS